LSENPKKSKGLAILVIGVWIGVALGVVGLLLIVDLDDYFGDGSPPIVAKKGELAPDFLLRNLKGEQIQLEDYRG